MRVQNPWNSLCVSNSSASNVSAQSGVNNRKSSHAFIGMNSVNDVFCRQSAPVSTPIKPSRVVNFGSENIDSSRIKLGCNYDEDSQKLQFGICSKNATRIDLCLFDKPVNGKVIKTISLKNNDGKWVAELDKKTQDSLNLNLDENKPVYYGFRAWGPNWPYDQDWEPGSDEGFISHVDAEGNRFNPNKLLTDPYAKEISHDPMSPKVQGISHLNDDLYATGDEHYLKDSAALGPKSIFVKQDNVSIGNKPKRPIKDDVIYEAHLKGLTMLDETIPKEYRGTYKGAAMKAKYLKNLGVTMVEFLPVQEFQNDANDHPDKYEKGQNYWGYETNSFFAPDRKYSSDKSPGGPTKEFKQMVKAFHDQGIKVCLDVVYNHTGEGSLWDGDTDTTKLYSMKGLDNQTYYELCDDSKYYWDNSGCGANFNAANPVVRDLIIDSVKYWSEEMGVDAFRHDLATVLGNNKQKHGFTFDAQNPNNYLQKVTREVDVRSEDGKSGSVDLIAEPWAMGDGSYQEGNFPKKWMEWSGQYRDILRKTFNFPEHSQLGTFASAVCGLSDTFKNDSTRSVNFITCHDGFTLKDLFSYDQKQNNQDGFVSDGGADYNTSSSNENNPVKQNKAIRNSLLTLMVSKGTPMILGGDELIRTQKGNNNTYNQDKPLNFINWNLDESQRNMQEFTRRAINFRNEHAALKDNHYYNGRDNNNNGLKDVTWLDSDSRELRGEYFDNSDNNFLGFRIDGTEYGDSASSIYTTLNKGNYDQQITLPRNLPNKQWYFVADTSEYSENTNNFMKVGEEVKVGNRHNISPRSMMVFIEK